MTEKRLQEVTNTVSYELGAMAAAYASGDLEASRYDIPDAFGDLAIAIDVNIEKFCDGYASEVGHMGLECLSGHKSRYDELLGDLGFAAEAWEILSAPQGPVATYYGDNNE